MCFAENGQKRAEKVSTFFSSSYWRRLSGAHRRAVMWFHCLSPCGRVPSGGKPLRWCWHITAPIINSRSALSFLLQLSSFLLTATLLLPCLCSHLCTRFIHTQHFSSNLLFQQSYLFKPFFTTVLSCTEWLSPNNYLHYLDPARIWPGKNFLNESLLESDNNRTCKNQTIQLIYHRHRQSLKYYNPQENYTITFKMGVQNQKSFIDFLFLLLSHTSLVKSSIPIFSLIIPLFFHCTYFLAGIQLQLYPISYCSSLFLVSFCSMML